MYIVTIDVGTTGVKSAVVDESGAIVRAGLAPLATVYPGPGRAEQDVRQYMPAAVRAVREAVQDIAPRDIAAIGLSGTMNGLIPLDGAGNPLHANIIHADTRSAAQCGAIAVEIGAENFFARTGNRIDAHMSLPKAAWVRDEMPDIHAKTRWYAGTKDYLRALLTGEWGVTDPTDASLTTAFSLREKRWDEPIARAGGMWGKLPGVRPSCDTNRALTNEAAGALGLLPGTPVAVGAGDGACATLGSGVALKGEGYMCLGSSGWTSVLLSDMGRDDRCFHYLDVGGELYTYTGTVQCVTAALDYMLGTVLGIPLTSEGFALAEALVKESPAGARGLLFSPMLMGERTPVWDPDTRGALVGMSLAHGRADLARAAYEGIAHALYEAFEIQQALCVAPKALRLVGGGAKSKVWPRMLASIVGVPVRVNEHPGEATALGAAFAAGVGVGLWPSLVAAAGLSGAKDEIAPDREEQAAYRGAHARYSAIYGHMRALRS